MWDLPGSGIEPVSPALAGGFLITRPPRKTFSLSSFLLSCPNSYQPEKINSAGFKTQMSGLWNVYDTNRNSDTRYWSSSVDLHTCQPITWGEEINVVKLGLHIATGLAVKDPALFQVSASGLADKLDRKEGWMPKNWWFWIMVLEKTLESPSNFKEIKPGNPKGNQP